jgi:hypothetical protein
MSDFPIPGIFIVPAIPIPGNLSYHACLACLASPTNLTQYNDWREESRDELTAIGEQLPE